MTANHISEREIIQKREINFPVEMVYEAFSNPKHLINWWGPNGFKNSFKEFTFKPGGSWRFIMHGPDGTDYTNRIVFKEIIQNKLISFTHGSDIDNDPDAFETEINFEKDGSKTQLTMKSIFKTAEACEAVKRFGAVEGGKQTLDKLESFLSLM